MKKLFFLPFLLGILLVTACGDDDTSSDAPSYQITINSPNADDKHVGDEITVDVSVAESSSTTVHHVNIKIINKATGEEIFNKPDDAHVHEEDGQFDFSEPFTLNIDEHTDWIMEVKAWGHEDGLAEVMETVEFHVHP